MYSELWNRSQSYTDFTNTGIVYVVKLDRNITPLWQHLCASARHCSNFNWLETLGQGTNKCNDRGNFPTLVIDPKGSFHCSHHRQYLHHPTVDNPVELHWSQGDCAPKSGVHTDCNWRHSPWMTPGIQQFCGSMCFQAGVWTHSGSYRIKACTAMVNALRRPLGHHARKNQSQLCWELSLILIECLTDPVFSFNVVCTFTRDLKEVILQS